MRRLAMLLVLCLTAGMLPASALGEVWNDSRIDANPGQAYGETGAPGLVAEPDPDAPAWTEDGEAVSVPEDMPVYALPESNLMPDGAEAETAEDGETPQPHTDEAGPVLSANEVTLGVGESFRLQPAMPEGVEAGISCATGDASVAVVSRAGVIKGVAPGDTVVTVSADNDTYAECFVHVRKAPDKLSFSAKAFLMGKGEVTDALRVRVGSVEGEYAGAYTLKSSNAKVVRVNGDGTLEGLKAGKVTLTARSYNGLKATCTVGVVNAPDRVQASLKSDTLGVGEGATVKVALPKGTASTISFASEYPEIASVDARTGEVTGLAPGKTRIRATTFNGKKSDVTVQVLPAPQALAFPSDSVKLGVGMKLDFEASVDEGAAPSVTYAVKKTAVARYADGVLTGVKKGRTVLTARTYNGLTAQCLVTVVAAPAKVTLPYKALSIGVGQELRLEPSVGKSASTFTYATSNKSVAKVSAAGVVTGVKKGSATVTVKTYNSKTFKLKVNVLGAPGSVSLSQDSAELGVGETLALSCTLPKDTAGSVSFASSDEAVAVVDAETGAVTAIGPGEAVITAATYNGKRATCAVKVLPLPTSIELNTSLAELGVGQTCPLTVTLSEGSRSALSFSTADAAVATVSREGVITAVGKGQTMITVGTAVPEVYAQVSVTVWPAPKAVKLPEKAATLNVGETYQLQPVITKGSFTRLTYASSDPAVAEVSDEGSVVALARGTTTLTVTAHNGKRAALKLTVLDPWYPESVTLNNAPDYLETGTTYQLTFTVKPAEALPDLEWTSSNPSIAWVDENDVLHTQSFGYVVLSATSRRNSEIRLEFTLAVQTDDVTLVIPARTTDVAGIPANLAKIDAVRTSALNQIYSLYVGGVIGKADAEKRVSIINNAFKDYAFPWMTPALQKYWKKENSEGGVKDFKPDRVYYGLPYVSVGRNREYNAAKVLKEGRFQSTDNGYYMLNQKNRLNGVYCGNDCSCFVDAAIWGTNSGHSDDRTPDIAKSSAYRTVKDFKAMRTGDLICLAYHHVAMFLYYVNPEKTKIMIIENGGIEPGTNTVHCMVMDVKWYTSRGYSVRRLASLG